jgi:endoglycosylceramidase
VHSPRRESRCISGLHVYGWPRGALAGFLVLAALLAGAGVVQAKMPQLHATRGADPAILDAAGRQVLLRGVADNQLGDYYQVDPTQPTTFPLTRRDFVRMHRLGFNVVRLVMSWSRLEPRRGHFSEPYLARVREAVRWARESHIYVVLDMHQDAWGKEVATPPGEACPPGFTPSIGWDGAPRWATYLDGMSTCHNVFREVSPAVSAAFDNFYDDRNGIQTHFVRAWARLARTFGASRAVAGFDLFNEPHPGTRGALAPREIGAFYERTIEAIRAAEQRKRGGFHHIVFFEPSVLYDVTASPGDSPPATFTDDRNVVFSPHLYPGTFSPLSTDQEFTAASSLAAAYDTTFWVGEWGWFSPHARDDYADIREFAAHEDDAVIGDAWWQWRQRCGDPHEFGEPGVEGSPIADGLNRYRCPGDRPLGIPPTTRRVLSRSYPRAAPGRIESLTSDPATHAFEITGADPNPKGSCVLYLWTPRTAAGRPQFAAGHVRGIRTRRAPGGWVTRGCAHGHYELRRSDT